VAPPRLRTMGRAGWVAQERSEDHGGRRENTGGTMTGLREVDGGRRENTGGIKTGLREVDEGNNGGQYILFVVFEK
jgi:hypothetical protein